MRRPSKRLPLALAVAVTGLLALVCVLLERTLDLTPGFMSLMVLIGPTAGAALVNGGRDGVVLGLLAGVACALAGCLGPSGPLPPEAFVPPVLCALGVAGAGIGLGLWSSWLQESCRVESERADQLARQMYQITREQDEGPKAQTQQTVTRADAAGQATSISYSTLLVKVQDIGTAVSGALDMDSLVAVVPDTARKLVGATRSELYLLDESGDWLVRAGDDDPYRCRANEGLFGWAIQHRQVLTRSYAEQDYNLRDLLESQPVECHAAVPLVVGRDVLGLLNVAAVESPPEQFDRLLRILANFSSLGVRNARLFQQIEDMARRDGLTGLFNHATFQDHLAETVDAARAIHQSCSVVLLDVDHFKQFNDTHGHQAGDFVLEAIADLLRSTAPNGSTAARYGGEEFVLLLPDTALAEAHALAEGFRATLEATALEYEGAVLHVTASIGVSTFPTHAGTPAELVQTADEALYAAKENGRNTVMVAEQCAV